MITDPSEMKKMLSFRKAGLGSFDVLAPSAPMALPSRPHGRSLICSLPSMDFHTAHAWPGEN